MRYENQNPQYIYLLEKIEELESQLRLKEETIGFAGRVAENALSKQFDAGMRMREFNSLPWYKKIFYKFEL